MLSGEDRGEQHTFMELFYVLVYESDHQRPKSLKQSYLRANLLIVVLSVVLTFQHPFERTVEEAHCSERIFVFSSLLMMHNTSEWCLLLTPNSGRQPQLLIAAGSTAEMIVEGEMR